MARGWGNNKGLISPELDGFLLLKCLNEKGVSRGKGRFLGKLGNEWQFAEE